MKNLLAVLVLFLFLISCASKEEASDAFGNFECEEVIVSAETMGIITEFAVNEGEKLSKNQLVALVDTSDKQLVRDEIMIQMELVKTKYRQAKSELKILELEISKANRDVGRYEKLFNQNAIAQEVLENYQHKLAILTQEYQASSLALSLLDREKEQLNIKLQVVNRDISKSYIEAPIEGTLLEKYVQAGELVTLGQPFFKVANLAETYLQAYVSERQLSQIALNDQVSIMYDSQAGLNKSKGRISFISSKAEFTPKTIQTRAERANLVYAIKIKVEYEEAIKIGMPAEVLFKSK